MSTLQSSTFRLNDIGIGIEMTDLISGHCYSCQEHGSRIENHFVFNAYVLLVWFSVINFYLTE